MLIGRNNYSRSRAKELGGGWEREKLQRTAKRYGYDGHGKKVRLRLLLLAAVVYGGESAHPQNEHASNKC